jgi:hypothetical protein
MSTFKVSFLLGTESRVENFRATSAGAAFAKCLQEHPGATLIQAWREGGFMGGHGITIWAPPSTVKVEAEPLPAKGEQLRLAL